MAKNLISVIIPAYNEEKRLPKTMKQIEEYAQKNKNYLFEIIVVDDCSEDKTVDSLKKTGKKIKILHNEKNMGKGFSIRRGMLEAKGDFLLFMDADSSTSINELDNFIPFFEEYDVIIGSRHIKEGSILVKQSLVRRIGGFFAHRLIHLFITSKIKDTMCGFKLFNKKSKFLFRKQINKGWGFDYELLFLAEKNNLKIKEVPVKWSDDSKSKVTFLGYLFALAELFKIRINHLLGEYN